MQIVLVKDVPNLGRVGDIVEVKNGYGRNYLIPQGMAVLATKGALKQADQLRAAADKRRTRELDSAQKLGAAIRELTLRFQMKVGDKGRLYGSVTSGEIAERVSEQLGIELDKRRVELDEPIKMLGNFEVPVNVHADVETAVRVEVIGENGETAADFAEENEGDATTIEANEELNPVASQPDGEY